MQLCDWTGGLIGGQDVPISLMRLPSRVYRIEDDDLMEAPVQAGRSRGSLMARVKALVARHGRISTSDVQELFPNEPERAVAIAIRNLARVRELRLVGREQWKGQRGGSGCGIWEVRA